MLDMIFWPTGGAQVRQVLRFACTSFSVTANCTKALIFNIYLGSMQGYGASGRYIAVADSTSSWKTGQFMASTLLRHNFLSKLLTDIYVTMCSLPGVPLSVNEYICEKSDLETKVRYKQLAYFVLRT